MVVRIAWNAGAVRARLLERHRLGGEGCHQLARRDSFEEALEDLRRGPYGHDVNADNPVGGTVGGGDAPVAHPHLGGMAAPAGGELLRTLAGWWEVLIAAGMQRLENLLFQSSSAQ